MQIFADRIEFCWTHLRGIGALENSLWGYDGTGMRVWLNALAIERPQSQAPTASSDVKESVHIPLDFYPLCAYCWITMAFCLLTLLYSGVDGQGYHHRR